MTREGHIQKKLTRLNEKYGIDYSLSSPDGRNSWTVFNGGVGTYSMTTKEIEYFLAGFGEAEYLLTRKLSNK